MTTSKIETKKGIEVFSDGTVVYDFEEAKEVISELKAKKHAVSDCILLMLYAQPDKPIFGRVLLVKEVFLLTKEILNEDDIQNAKFIPYRWGMYSFTVGNALANLEYSGYIERKGKKNAKLEQFELTDKGKEFISKIWNALPAMTQETAKEKRKGWDQLGYDGILRLVYRKYPKYKEKSRLKERYKTITWGKGVG